MTGVGCEVGEGRRGGGQAESGCCKVVRRVVVLLGVVLPQGVRRKVVLPVDARPVQDCKVGRRKVVPHRVVLHKAVLLVVVRHRVALPGVVRRTLGHRGVVRRKSGLLELARHTERPHGMKSIGIVSGMGPIRYIGVVGSRTGSYLPGGGLSAVVRRCWESRCVGRSEWPWLVGVLVTVAGSSGAAVGSRVCDSGCAGLVLTAARSGEDGEGIGIVVVEGAGFPGRPSVVGRVPVGMVPGLCFPACIG